MIDLDNAPDGEVLVTRRQAIRVRRPATSVKNGRTRCPECLARLAYTDWDNPEKVIRAHRETECPHLVVLVPKPRTRSRGVGRPRRLR